jgi:hypothetical protein
VEGAGVEHLDGVVVDSDGRGSDFVHIQDSETGSSTNSDFTYLTTSEKFDDEDTEDKIDNGNDKNDKLDVAGDDHLDGVVVDSDGSGSDFVHIRDRETDSSTNSDFTYLTTSEKFDDEEIEDKVDNVNDENDKLDIAGNDHLDGVEADLDGSGSNFVHIRDSETGSSTNSDFTFLTTSEKLDDEVEVGNDHDTDVETGDANHEDNPENHNGVYNVAPIDYFFISNWSQ